MYWNTYFIHLIVLTENNNSKKTAHNIIIIKYLKKFTLIIKKKWLHQSFINDVPERCFIPSPPENMIIDLLELVSLFILYSLQMYAFDAVKDYVINHSLMISCAPWEDKMSTCNQAKEFLLIKNHIF